MLYTYCHCILCFYLINVLVPVLQSCYCHLFVLPVLPRFAYACRRQPVTLCGHSFRLFGKWKCWLFIHQYPKPCIFVVFFYLDKLTERPAFGWYYRVHYKPVRLYCCSFLLRCLHNTLLIITFQHASDLNI